jgi:hypothetical protein
MAEITISTPTATAAPAGNAEPKRASASTRKNVDKTADDNEAIVRCMKAWNSAYKKEAANLDDDESDYPAEKAGNEAYLRATPPLVGYENICQFIACINFAAMTDIVSHRETELYLGNARVALAALSLQPKPQATGVKSGGKPSANPAENPRE